MGVGCSLKGGGGLKSNSILGQLHRYSFSFSFSFLRVCWGTATVSITLTCLDFSSAFVPSLKTGSETMVEGDCIVDSFEHDKFQQLAYKPSPSG